jgi:hypothetical protein
MDETELRKLAAKALGIASTAISARIWNAVVKKRLVQMVLDADDVDVDIELENLVAEYQFLSDYTRGAFNEPTERAGEDTSFEEGDRRLSALASIIAVEAERFEAVREFRRTHLESGLLLPTEIEAWIEELSGVEGFPSEGDLLQYFGQHRVRSVRVQPGGVLDSLRRASRLLQTTYDWTPSQAVLFVLSGTDVDIPKARISVRRVRPFTALSRITIDVDPRTSPREVQRLYSAARRDLRKGGDKDISAKHAALAVFAAEQGLPSSEPPAVAVRSVRPQDALTEAKAGIRIMLDMSGDKLPVPVARRRWPELLAIWNGQVREPDWAYKNDNRVNDFARDVRAAWERVTGRPWTPPKDAEDEADALEREL